MIQIDMEMPATCWSCKLEMFTKGCPCNLGYADASNYKMSRHMNCPLKKVPSGKWINCGQGVWECSNCGNGIVISEQWLYKHHKYCGQCGAKMVEEL